MGQMLERGDIYQADTLEELAAQIGGPPFVATLRSPAGHYTMGGLEIDTKARVLNEEVISDFYAAGEVTGGIHAGSRLGGNAQADIIVFGKIADGSAAGE